MSLGLFGHHDEELGSSLHYSVSRLAAAQAALGDRVEVHLIASGGPLTFCAQGVQFTFHRGWGPPRVRNRLGPFGRQISPGQLHAIGTADADIVHFHGVRQFHLMFYAVALKAARARTPLVAQDRGGRGARALESWAQRRAFGKTAAVLAASRACREDLVRGGYPEAATFLVPNGVDRTVFAPAGRRAPHPGSRLRVLFVGRLVEHKDPLTMAEAVVELGRRGHDVEATVVSRGHLRDAVAATFRSAGIPATFIDHLPQGALADEYRRADVVLLTTRLQDVSEGWNQVALEAMASGVPVVATDVPGVKDCLGPGAKLVPAESPKALADAAERLLTDGAAWNAERERGLRRAASFSWDAVAAYTRSIYLSCTDGESSREPVPDTERWLAPS
jgi:glycosyltransferase involved in cell wall biosynthesis